MVKLWKVFAPSLAFRLKDTPEQYIFLFGLKKDSNGYLYLGIYHLPS